MSISVSCQSCGATLKAPEKAAGKSSKCPHCGGQVKVPTGQQAPVIVARSVSTRPQTESKIEPLPAIESEPLPTSRKRLKSKQLLLLGGSVITAGLLIFLAVTFLTGSSQPGNNQLAHASKPVGTMETHPEGPKSEPGKTVDQPIPKPGVPVTVSELLEAFKNEVAAKDAYVGKVLDVTGIFVHQGDKGGPSDNGWHVYLSEKPVTYFDIKTLQGHPLSTVLCFPAPGQQKNLAFSPGEKVTIRGTCVKGYSVHVHLKDCFLVKSHKEQQIAREREVRKDDVRRVASGPATKTDPSRISGSNGDVLEVSGTVTKVTKEDIRLDGWASPSGYEKEELCVTITGGKTADRLECYFRPKHKDVVTKLRAGQQITIRGILDHKEGYLHPGEGEAFLKFCTLGNDKEPGKTKKGK